MATATVTTIIEVNLKLSRDDASWLRRLCQNPIDPEEFETEKDQESRESIFKALAEHSI